MPRADYDTTGAILTGLGDATPLDYITSVDCRLVIDQHTLFQRPLGGLFEAYVNWNGVSVNSGSLTQVGLVREWDASLATVWEIPEGSGQYWVTLRTAIITPLRPGFPPYRRAWLVDVNVF